MRHKVGSCKRIPAKRGKMGGREKSRVVKKGNKLGEKDGKGQKGKGQTK